jgi:hypothetical protein
MQLRKAVRLLRTARLALNAAHVMSKVTMVDLLIFSSTLSSKGQRKKAQQ